jgi:hypothetical protein
VRQKGTLRMVAYPTNFATRRELELKMYACTKVYRGSVIGEGASRLIIGPIIRKRRGVRSTQLERQKRVCA